MGLDLFLVLIASLQVNAGTYFISIPNVLIPGIDLSVRVAVFNTTRPVDTICSIQHASNHSVVSTARGSVTAGMPKVFKLKVAENVLPDQYKVVVTGSGGLDVRNESYIRFEKNSVLTFIQTDKTRYSGGQEVKYRALLMRADLMPYQGPVTLTIYDGEENMIEQVEHPITTEGVVSGKLQLSREPVFGMWSITAEIINMNTSVTNLFEVRDYILPRFEVTVTVPDEVKDTVNSFDVSVQARFTFGDYVLGNCTIQIYNPLSPAHYIEYSKQLVNMANFTIPMAEIKSKLLMDSKIYIRALVTDNATFLTMAKEKELHITRDIDNQITFIILDNRDYFSPGFTYQTPIQVRRKGTNIGKAGSIRVVATVTEARVKDCTLRQPPQKWLDVTQTTKPEFLIDFDVLGYGVLKFATETSFNRIDFELSYGSSKDRVTVHAFTGDVVNQISLSADKAYAKVGEKVTIEAATLQNLEGPILFEVLARGILLRNETVQLQNTKAISFDLPITQDMVPLSFIQSTILTRDGGLLQNHIVLLVNGSPCKNNVTVAVNGTSFKPGDGMLMTITASPQSTVYVLAEDERNRIFGQDNDVFVDEISESLWKVGAVNPNIKRSLQIKQEQYIIQRDVLKRSSNLNINENIILTDFLTYKRTSINSLLMYNNDRIPMQCSTQMIPGTSAVYTTIPTTIERPITTTTASPIRYPGLYNIIRDNPILSSMYKADPVRTEALLEYYFRHGGFTSGGIGGGGGGIGCYGKRFLLCDNVHAVYLLQSHTNSLLDNLQGYFGSIGAISNPLDHQEALQLNEIVRNKFPETWLWEDYKTGTGGSISVATSVPDSLTTWVISAFATNKDVGLGIPGEKTKITVLKNFFVTMELPQSVILGEEFLLQITAFNHLGARTQVQMQIERSDDPLNPIPASTVVESGQGHSTFAKVTPNQAGTLRITVRARAGDFFVASGIDMVAREVTVHQQGIRRTTNHQRLIISRPGDPPYRETINLPDEPNMIPNTKLMHMILTGDILVPTITGLQHLIKEPHGCGEQNMVNFAPDVFITKYMKITGQLSKDIEKTALSDITKGYMTELTFRRSDGSFSALHSDSNSGTWLTAYVLKCFYQAQDLITIDKKTLSSAMEWLLKQQNSDGSFRELTPVRWIDHPFSQLRLTAFSLIALLEATGSSTTDQFPTWKSVINNGFGYLENKLPHINDAYSLSIACYALAKYGSQFQQSCFTRLENSKIMKDGMAYWTANTFISRRNTLVGESQDHFTAKDTEATAYALLTYMSLGRYAEGLSIVKWIASQRNPYGGFHTTQDTVVSIQALTEYSLYMHNTNPRQNHDVNFSTMGAGFAYNYGISQKNYNVSHRYEFPSNLNSLDIVVTGSGIAVFDVVKTFYVSKVQNHEDINVNVTILKESINSLTLRPVLRWNGRSKSSMLIMEIEMPTGFIADVDLIKAQKLVGRHEIKGQTLILYFGGLDANSRLQVDVKMNRADPVVGNRECHVTVYDYYEPEKQSVATYESGVLRKASICSVCPLCRWCTETLPSQNGVGRK